MRFRPSTRIVADFEPCIVKEDGESGWVKIWEDVRLADATFGTALMGGASLDSKWNVASNYLRPGYDPGTSDTSNTAVTNVVDAAIPGMAHTLAICGLAADVPAKRRHSVAVGADFDPGPSPVRLADVKLALTPSGQEAMTWGWGVRGCGAIGVSGAGSVVLAADLPENVGLDVDAGTAVIASRRTVGGPVRVKAGARLEFAIATGCGYAGYALDGVACGVAGNAFSTAHLDDCWLPQGAAHAQMRGRAKRSGRPRPRWSGRAFGGGAPWRTGKLHNFP